MELYHTYRPSKLSQVIGNESVIAQLKRHKDHTTFPHASLFQGPSGCGKTTLARIVSRRVLKAGPSDIKEINSAGFRGIDTIRDISERMNLAPMNGPARVWIIDEVHQMTNQAQEAFLKTLEDTPSHVYFMLATTDPAKLLPTLRNRCTEFTVCKPPADQLEAHLAEIAEKEGIDLAEDILEEIIKAADFSVRKSLVILGQLIEVDPKDQIRVIETSIASKSVIDLCRILLNPKAKWAEITSIIKSIDDDPERARRAILGYMTNVALGKWNPRANLVIQCFRDNFYDCGKAGLVAACSELFDKE